MVPFRSLRVFLFVCWWCRGVRCLFFFFFFWGGGGVGGGWGGGGGGRALTNTCVVWAFSAPELFLII